MTLRLVPKPVQDPVTPERQADIDRGYCSGCAKSGLIPWCKLCRWSQTYWRNE